MSLLLGVMLTGDASQQRPLRFCRIGVDNPQRGRKLQQLDNSKDCEADLKITDRDLPAEAGSKNPGCLNPFQHVFKQSLP